MLCGIEWKARDVVRVDGISDKTTSCVGIESKHEEECEMVSVPKGLEALVPDLPLGGGVHQKHDEEHKVTSDTTRLRVVDLECGLPPNFFGRIN
jgi:hypothetical protein